MVGAGSAMALRSAIAGGRRGVRAGADGPTAALAAARSSCSGPLGFVSLEAGWLVTEWGRQPWIVHGLMRTADAVTDFPYKAAPFWLFTLVYLFLGAAVVYLLARQIGRAGRPRDDGAGPAHGA